MGHCRHLTTCQIGQPEWLTFCSLKGFVPTQLIFIMIFFPKASETVSWGWNLPLLFLP